RSLRSGWEGSGSRLGWVAWCGGFFFIPIAVFVFAVGVSGILTRVEIGPVGIAKSPKFPNGFHMQWDEVLSWSVVDLKGEDNQDNFNHRAVRFVAGERRVEVRESEISRP